MESREALAVWRELELVADDPEEQLLQMLRYAARDQSVETLATMLGEQDLVAFKDWRQTNLESLERCRDGTLYVNVAAGRARNIAQLWSLLPSSIRLVFEQVGIGLSREASLVELLDDVEGLLADVRKQSGDVTETECHQAQLVLEDLASLMQNRKVRTMPAVSHMQANVHVALRRTDSAAAASSHDGSVPASMFVPLKGKRRRVSAGSGTHTAHTRSEQEAKELARLVHEWAAVLMHLNMPIVAVALETANPQGVLLRRFDGKRPSTLKQRLNVYKRLLRTWLVPHGLIWFRSEHETIDMLEETALASAAKTWAATVMSMIKFVEDAGAVPVSMRLSESPVLIRHSESMVTEQSRGRRQRRKAPPMSIVMVAALEQILASTKPGITAGARMLAWGRLLKVWGTCRHADTTGLLSGSIRQIAAGWTFALERTKTTGDDKRVTMLQIYVSNEAYVLFGDWFESGLEACRQLGADPCRDYLLPGLEHGLEVSRPSPMNYTEALLLDRQLLSVLCVPEFCTSTAGTKEVSM